MKHTLISLTVAGACLCAATTLNAGNFTANFNDGQVPPNSMVYGNALVEASGGVGDTGCLKLTKNVNSQSGSYVIDDLDGFAPVYGFRAAFMARIGGGSSTPADGWSFVVAPDLPDGTWSETGTGTGLTVMFDTYDNTDGDPNNTTGEAPQIRLAIGGQIIATTPLLPLSDLINNTFVPVEIKLNPDGSFDLTYNGKAHFSKFFFPGYQALTGARIGFGARTGGLNANHWIDDLNIETFTVPQPGFVERPQDSMLVNGASATFNIVLNNGDGAAIQWLRDGAVIPGATDTTYTLGPVTMADNGAKISVRVTVGTTTVTSEEATITVADVALPATPVISYDFNNGTVPPEAVVYGAGISYDLFTPWVPYVSQTGGVANSGVLQLTEAVNDQSGAFLIADPHAGAPVYGVAARFDVRIGGGSEPPADGMSFNFAADLPDATVGMAEEGAGSGLRVCFDIYNNGNNEAPAITLKWGETVIVEVKVPLSEITTGDTFADVIVRLTPDGNLDVAWNGKALIYREPVLGFASIANGRFGFYARTGGLNANQWVDNLRIYTYLTAPLRVTKQPADQTALVGKTATFDVEVSTPTGATYQWLRNGAPVNGATASTYTTPASTLADDGAKYKVEVKLGAETVVSEEVTLSVVDLTAPTNPQVSYDFNSGVPAGADIGGTYVEGFTPVAFVDTTGGVGESGVLKLTTSENSQAGGFRSALIQEGAQLLDFTFAADVLAGNGTETPADGFSINFANDLPITAPGDAENGAGTGVTVAFDTYDNVDANPNNEAGEAPSIDIRYGGQEVATRRVPLALLNSGDYMPILLRVQQNGTLDLAVGDTVVYHGFQIPNYVPLSGVKIALYARTGGANASYWFDNVRLAYTVPATVDITDEPDSALVLVGQSATFQVQVSNPQGVTYQWRRNGSPITGANAATYTTPALTSADDGGAYSVVVTGPGNSVTSQAAIASVMAKFDAGASPAINLDFNDGNIPADGAVFGNAFVIFAGGVNDTAYMQLTEAVNSQNGAFLLNTPAGVESIDDFTATWMMRVGGGTATPADGFSFVLGSDVGDVSFGEDGAGSGLVVSFDTYRNANELAPEITIRYGSADVANRPVDISVLRTDGGFERIGVRVNRNGTLDLYYGDFAIYRALPLPGYTPFASGRFGWGARTGGLNDNHWVDDVKIALNVQPPLGPTMQISLMPNGAVRIVWPGAGTLQTTTSLQGLWTDLPSATSPYEVQPTDTMRLFRVKQ